MKKERYCYTLEQFNRTSVVPPYILIIFQKFSSSAFSALSLSNINEKQAQEKILKNNVRYEISDILIKIVINYKTKSKTYLGSV